MNVLETLKGKPAKRISKTKSPEMQRVALEHLEAEGDLQAERERHGSIHARLDSLQSELNEVEALEVRSKTALDQTLTDFALGQASQADVTAKREQMEATTKRAQELKQMLEVLQRELTRAESDYPPSPLKQKKDRFDRMTRQTAAAIFEELKRNEMPAGMDRFMRRCWAAFITARENSSMPAMLGELFGLELSRVEAQEDWRELLEEFVR